MKRTSIFMLLAIGIALIQCSQKTQSDSATEAGDEVAWPGMNEFHMILAETYHPFKDAADLKPIKTRASELSQAAEDWVNAPLPGIMDTKDIRSKLEQLKNRTADLQVLVNAANEQEIGTALDSVHTLYHEIDAAWHSNTGSKPEH